MLVGFFCFWKLLVLAVEEFEFTRLITYRTDKQSPELSWVLLNWVCIFCPSTFIWNFEPNERLCELCGWHLVLGVSFDILFFLNSRSNIWIMNEKQGVYSLPGKNSFPQLWGWILGSRLHWQSFLRKVIPYWLSVWLISCACRNVDDNWMKGKECQVSNLNWSLFTFPRVSKLFIVS